MSFEQLMQHAHDIQQKAIMMAKADADGPSLGGFIGLDRDKSPLQRASVHRRIEESFADVPSIFEPFAEMPRSERVRRNDRATDERVAELIAIDPQDQGSDQWHDIYR